MIRSGLARACALCVSLCTAAATVVLSVPAVADTPLPDISALASTVSPPAALLATASTLGLVSRPEVWTKSTRVFEASDGIRTALIGSTPLNYQDASAVWQPINDSLGVDLNPGFAWSNQADSYTAEFPTDLSSGPIRLTRNGQFLAFSLTGASGAGVVNGNTITYADALPGITVTYAVTPSGLSETLSLADATAQSQFAYQVTASDGMQLAANDDRSITASTDSGFFATLPPPWVTDANQDMSGWDNAVQVALTSVAGHWLLTQSLSPTWLADPQRAWPVTLDPTVDIDGTDTQDCELESGNPTTSFCTNPAAVVGFHSDTNGIRREVFQFDVSAVPTTATLTRGVLALWEGITSFGSNISTSVYQINQGWNTCATWQHASCPAAWNTPGGSITGSAQATLTVGGTADTDTPHRWDILPLTRSWVTGGIVNHGIVLKSNSESTSGAVVQFSSSQASSNRPVLEISYNDAPNPVTNLTATNSTTLTPTFSGTISDPDSGQTITGLFYIRHAGDSSWTVLNGGTGSSINSSNGAGTSSYTVPSGMLSPGGSYQWAMAAEDGPDSDPTRLIGPMSGIQSFLANNYPPLPPISSSTHPASGGCYTNTSPTFAWNNGGDSTVDQYSYLFDHSPSEDWNPDAGQGTTTTSTSQSFGPLSDGEYYFHVKGHNPVGWGNPNSYNVGIDNNPPTTPTGLSSSSHPNSNPTTNPNFTVSWNASTDSGCGVSGYYWYVDHNSAANNSRATSSDNLTGALSATASNLADGIWYFHVRASDPIPHLSNYATYGPATIGTPPNAPTITSPPSAGCSTNNSPTFQWSDTDTTGTGIQGYSYVLDHTPTTTPDQTSEGTNTSHSYSLLADGTWYFHIIAENGLNIWSSPTHFQYAVDTGSPTQPSGLNSPDHPDATPSANRNLTVNWQPSTDSGCGLSGYGWYVDGSSLPNNSRSISLDTSTSTTSASDMNLADGVYYFHVRAVDVVNHTSNYATYGPVTINGSLVSVVKSVSPAASTAGSYDRGTLLTYSVQATNNSTAAPTTFSLTDVISGSGLSLANTDVTVTGTDINNPNTPWTVHCLQTNPHASCLIANGNEIDLAQLPVDLPPSGVLTITYSALATGIDVGCTTATNTATATNAAGSTNSDLPSGPISVTICDSGLGIEPWWSYINKPVGPQSSASVNVMNGNLVVQATDSTAINARGHFAYVIRRTYNSQDTTLATLPGSIGAGWQLNVGQADDLAGAGVTATGLSVPPTTALANPLGIIYIDRDGTRHVFSYRNTTASTSAPLDVTSLPIGTPADALAPVNPLLLPSTLGGTSGFSRVCIDSFYQAPAGVHMSLWRYVGTGASSCAGEVSDSSARVIGYGAMRTDRLAYNFDGVGHLLDMVDGSGVDLRYTYENTISPLARLTSVDEPRSCSGTVGGSTCRAITLSYAPDGSETDVTDPAGRITKYLFDSGTAKHLLTVVNPDDSSGNPDRISYTYQGVNSANCTGAATGQLCTITDARGHTTSFTYAAHTPRAPRIASLTDRLGTTTTLTYTDTAPVSVTADTGTERTRYVNIDSFGRVGEIDDTDTAGDPALHVTRFTWDTISAPCTVVAGSTTGTHTSWTRRDNNLCQLSRVNATGLPTQTTNYLYTPEGALLSQQILMGGNGPDLYTTNAYAAQYPRANGQPPLTALDTVNGSGDVTVGDRTQAIGNGTSGGDGTVLYALNDRIAALTPRGNAPGATAANFTTTYTVANSGSQPDVNPGTTACTARNSGSICSVSAPDSGATKAVTTYTYDGFGQKQTATVPAFPGASYSYTYYSPGAKDLTGHTDAEGWLEAVTDPAGNFVFFGYDAAGNVARSWDRNQTHGQTVSSMQSNPPSGYAQTLHATSLSGMPWRYVLAHTDPEGNTTAYSADQDGNQTAITTPRTYTTTQTFDAADDLLTSTAPADPSNPTVNTYDAFGNLASTQSPNGGYTVHVYDAANRQVKLVRDRGPYTGTAAPPGCFVTDTGANAYPPIPTAEIVCATTTNYDQLDNVTASTDPTGATTTYTYDPANRQITKTVPRSSSVSYTTTTNYDPDGNVLDVCPPRQTIETGNSACTATGVYSTHHTYSEADRVLTSTTYRAVPATVHGDPRNAPATSTDTVTYTYDADGNRTSTADANNHTVSDTYSNLDRKSVETRTRLAGLDNHTVYGYDPAGNLTSVISPGGQALGNGAPALTLDGNVDHVGTNLVSRTNPYRLPNGNVTYSSITLTNGAWIAGPTGNPVTTTITVGGLVSICSSCGISVDGEGYAGGVAAALGVGTGGFTTGGAGNGPGGGAGGQGSATSGGGGGGGGYRSVGGTGQAGTPAGGSGGAGGPAYGTPDIGTLTTAADGSGGGAGGTAGNGNLGAGGLGGGALHLTANVIAVDGVIQADGFSGQQGRVFEAVAGGGGGGGAGGTIWLTAAQVTGSGHLNVFGGAGGAGQGIGTIESGDGGPGANGRIRIDTDDLSPTLNYTNTPYRTTIGRITAYSYDKDNRLLDTVTGSSSTSAAAAGVVSTDGGSNVRTRLQYDQDGDVNGQFDPRAFTSSTTTPDRRFETATTYDANDRPIAVYRPYADNGSYSDLLGGPATSSQCQDATSTPVADYSTLTGVRVCHVSYGYDHDGNRTSLRLPTYTSAATGRVYTYTYTADDLLASVSTPDPQQPGSGGSPIVAEQYNYDGDGRQTVQTHPSGNQPSTTSTAYTLDGLVDTVTPQAGAGGLSHRVSYGYDANGNRISETDTVDSSTTQTSTTDYYSDNSRYTNVDPAGHTTSYSYDPAGNPVAVYSPSANAEDDTNQAGTPAASTYFDDNLLRTTNVSHPTTGGTAQNRITAYGYNAAGDKLTVNASYINSSGTVTVDGGTQSFSYYKDGLLSGVTGRNSSGSQTFTYDPAGNPTHSTDGTGAGAVNTDTSYYLNGLLRTVVENGVQTSYSYDGAGAVAARQTGAITTSYSYNDAELPTTTTGGATGTTFTTGYDDQARPTAITYGSGGDVLTRAWNPDSTLASQTLATNGGTALDNWAYSYDGLYRVTAADNTAGTTSLSCTSPAPGLQCFGYNNANELIDVKDSTADRTASYDADGNRRSYGDNGPNSTVPVLTWHYNPDDTIKTGQHLVPGNPPTPVTDTYQYAQPFGGITNDGCSSYGYDGLDRLTQVAGTTGNGCPTPATINYTYDSQDRQVSRNETGSGTRPGITTNTYDGLSTTLAAETLPGGGATNYTLDATGDAVAVNGGNPGSQILTPDGHGNIAAAIAANGGALACTYRYDPWGNPASTGQVGTTCTSTGTANTANDIQYAGQSKDPSSGTYQLGTRTYDPTKAGFLTPDAYRNAPAQADQSIGTDPLTRNTYNYVNGDPVNLADPTGHRACSAADIREGCAEGNATPAQIASARDRGSRYALQQLRDDIAGLVQDVHSNGRCLGDAAHMIRSNLVDNRLVQGQCGDLLLMPVVRGDGSSTVILVPGVPTAESLASFLADVLGINDAKRCLGGSVGNCALAASTFIPVGRLGRAAEGVARAIPLGFGSAEDFESFGKALAEGLDRAGYGDARAAFQGSSVTGRSYRTGQPFDLDRLSDFDIALADKDLLQAAADYGVELRSAGLRTAPLSEGDLRGLGLDQLQSDLQGLAQRPVNFMLFDTLETAVARGESIMVAR